ncbi:hypothetical protein GO001_34040 [Streptomyces sp. NRRL B-1677]|uniref:hypothetical protein n=1 Tax=Streptomyces TaxID=1883 RepID=UPI001319E81C|nr:MULTISPECIES: hypothetical protein [Streptomyces]MBF6050136.1 hypothetical protein [Streptomyces sp. NRRL B-1677]
MSTGITDHSARAVLVLLVLGLAGPAVVLRPHADQFLHAFPAPEPQASAPDAADDGEP